MRWGNFGRTFDKLEGRADVEATSDDAAYPVETALI
jgi:hypothetical protein